MTTRMNLAAIAIAALMATTVVTPGLSQSGGSPATKGYMDAMSKMQSGMPKDHKGDPDTDFARMMIPHHQGAIDMAKVEIQYGKDPDLRKMAEKMVKDQEKEIADLQKWLKDKGK